jgi:ATP-dependent Clp protease ATP-binding subunit ClpC
VFERFTEPARQVVVVAQEEARMMRHAQVGTEHLLVGLADVPALGLTRSQARAEVVRAVGLGDEPAEASGMLPFTATAQEALEQSTHESMKLGHDTVEPATCCSV